MLAASPLIAYPMTRYNKLPEERRRGGCSSDYLVWVIWGLRILANRERWLPSLATSPIRKSCIDMISTDTQGQLALKKWPVSAVCLLLAAMLVTLDVWSAPSELVAAETKADTVRLVIDYGDGVEKHFTRIAWKPGMTVLDVMEQAKRSKRGITFDYRGKGETAFLMKIDDLKNEGGGLDSRNWSFSVNDELAEKSFGIYEPKRGDLIVWKFGLFMPNP